MIRLYKKNETNTIISIWEQAAAVAHPFLSKDFNAKIKKAMTDIYIPNSKVWVYEISNKIVGFIAMFENEIGGLFVLPKCHGAGIGTDLLNHVYQYHEVLAVEVFHKNTIGKPFYKKHGFKTIKTYIHEESNEKVLRMHKKRKCEFTARASIAINTSVSKVWEALVTPKIAKTYFFGADITSNWSKGSPITFKGEFKGNDYEEKGVILNIIPNQQLQYTHWSNLETLADIPENYRIWTFNLTVIDGFTQLSVSENNIPTVSKQKRSNKFWKDLLITIKQIVEN